MTGWTVGNTSPCRWFYIVRFWDIQFASYHLAFRCGHLRVESTPNNTSSQLRLCTTFIKSVFETVNFPLIPTCTILCSVFVLGKTKTKRFFCFCNGILTCQNKNVLLFVLPKPKQNRADQLLSLNVLLRSFSCRKHFKQYLVIVASLYYVHKRCLSL